MFTLQRYIISKYIMTPLTSTSRLLRRTLTKATMMQMRLMSKMMVELGYLSWQKSTAVMKLLYGRRKPAPQSTKPRYTQLQWSRGTLSTTQIGKKIMSHFAFTLLFFVSLLENHLDTYGIRTMWIAMTSISRNVQMMQNEYLKCRYPVKIKFGFQCESYLFKKVYTVDLYDSLAYKTFKVEKTI